MVENTMNVCLLSLLGAQWLLMLLLALMDLLLGLMLVLNMVDL